MLQYTHRSSKENTDAFVLLTLCLLSRSYKKTSCGWKFYSEGWVCQDYHVRETAPYWGQRHGEQKIVGVLLQIDFRINVGMDKL
jgi:hypothetical protein